MKVECLFFLGFFSEQNTWQEMIFFYHTVAQTPLIHDFHKADLLIDL